MSIAGSIALYFVIWWITLFAVLPLWTRPRDATKEEGGWRGAPERPMMLRKALVNSVVALLVWALVRHAMQQDWLSIQGP